MKELIIAFGLFLFIEGILYALFPSKMKNMLKKMEVIKDSITGFAFAKKEKFKNTIEIKNILRLLNFILFFNIPNYKKANNSKN